VMKVMKVCCGESRGSCLHHLHHFHHLKKVMNVMKAVFGDTRVSCLHHLYHLHHLHHLDKEGMSVMGHGLGCLTLAVDRGLRTADLSSCIEGTNDVRTC
jgi:hypothetical protein